MANGVLDVCCTAGSPGQLKCMETQSEISGPVIDAQHSSRSHWKLWLEPCRIDSGFSVIESLAPAPEPAGRRGKPRRGPSHLVKVSSSICLQQHPHGLSNDSEVCQY